MKIELLEGAGAYSTFQALRLPYGKEPRSVGFSEFREDNKGIVSHTSTNIDSKDFELLERLVKSGDEHAKAIRGMVVYTKIVAPIYWWREAECYRAGHERLSSTSTMHIDCKGLSGEELQKAKSEIPMGKECECVDMWSYQCLRNIYKQRINHRLPEWHEFCSWIETLPFAKQLIIGE